MTAQIPACLPYSAEQIIASHPTRVSMDRPPSDPTNRERDFSDEESEFMKAMQAYKASSGRMFPTWSEVLEVLTGLGYAKDMPAPAC